jgi:hypothetical protein
VGNRPSCCDCGPEKPDDAAKALRRSFSVGTSSGRGSHHARHHARRTSANRIHGGPASLSAYIESAQSSLQRPNDTASPLGATSP